MVIHDEDKESECALLLDVGDSSNSGVSDHNSKKKKNSYDIDKNQCDISVKCGVISNGCEINTQDIEKLRRVYKKCKLVMRQIENKYGHYLDLQEDIGSDHKQNKNEISIKQCNCALNKKIIFNDDGTQLCKESPLENHICLEEKGTINGFCDKIPLNKSNLQIEYDNNEIQLPADLPSLVNILQNTEIDVTYRNKVIHKMKSVKQEHQFDIKFNRRSLIDAIKKDPNEVFYFEGTNLSTIPGYL